VWIPLLGVLLAGIVFMQVEVLKLNAGIGRSLERGSALQAQNELLRAGVSRLSDDQRIERVAAQLGMLMPSPEQLKFVGTGAGSTQRALSSIHAPNSTDFLAQLPMIGAAAAPQGATVNTGVGLASTAAASTGASTGSTSTAGTAGTAADTSAGTTAAAGASTPQSAVTTPAAPTVSSAPTTSAGATDQSGSSSSGGVGATPVGG
jgi:cell division protein FtsL